MEPIDDSYPDRCGHAWPHPQPGDMFHRCAQPAAHAGDCRCHCGADLATGARL